MACQVDEYEATTAVPTELDAIGQSTDQMLLDLDVPECVAQAGGGSAWTPPSGLRGCQPVARWKADGRRRSGGGGTSGEDQGEGPMAKTRLWTLWTGMLIQVLG